ncbi:DNA-formamidopyrimidine glycosylase family protein [Gracilimonas sp. BCB1]|uniref:DNA-formamidopyrimidine glycosylase family protein n=1 Tax=Gracilimonas sp. BCB1 TaxID=3152362 RepID=UPI0032D9344C
MPEGPEIWRAADKISDAIAGKEIEEVFFAFDELKPFELQLKGLKIDSITPRGKAIVTAFGNNLNLYSHNQLYGKWMISKDGNEPDTNRSLRVAIHTSDSSAFLYSASEIEMLEDDEVENHPYIKNLDRMLFTLIQHMNKFYSDIKAVHLKTESFPHCF